MIYVIYGTDEYTTHEKLKSVKESLGDPEALSNNMTILDGNNVSPDELCNYVQAMPFLGTARLVIVYNLISKLSSKKGRTTKKTGPTLTDDFNSVLKDHVCPTTTLVLVENVDDPKFDPTKSELFADISDVKFVQCNLLTASKLSQWIQNYVAKQNGKIELDAVTLLANNIGSDLWALSGNIDKLISYTNGKVITKDAVLQMVPEFGHDNDIWLLLNAVCERKLDLAIKYYTRLLSNSDDPYRILSMLVFQLRKVIKCKLYLNEGHTFGEIKVFLGNDWKADSYIKQANLYKLDELQAYYKRFFETDVAMKTGTMEPETAVTVLISEICVGI